ncbi:hypothetical protein P3X46_008471 [Hevea brasiliensis]|uniref:glutathione synthase n=1 Tax=Hevea brasiliensis TaxID=3981 RepID=A0ABQ9MKP9_HEVBR|nr:hypothetical protein P3X46_008471 [Hevea brasiliensis]
MANHRIQEETPCESVDQAHKTYSSDPFVPLSSPSNGLKQDGKELPEVEDNEAKIKEEKINSYVSPGKRPEEEAPLPSLEAKPPKKVVSMNDRVEEIETSKKKIKKKKSKERLTSFEQEEDEPKPLKSILKEWRARLLMEQSLAIKCPSISYHLAGTKKIQQELAKPNVLERFLEDKEDITKLLKCFAGLWSLDDTDIVKRAIERPELFVMKPQREGGGNNIYGDDVKENLLRLQREGTEEDAAYILMQRIFPTVSPTFLVLNGISHKDHAVSELGVYGAYLRNKDKVIINDQCGHLMRTKVSSSNEGGVVAGFAVLDSIYLMEQL